MCVCVSHSCIVRPAAVAASLIVYRRVGRTGGRESSRQHDKVVSRLNQSEFWGSRVPFNRTRVNAANRSQLNPAHSKLYRENLTPQYKREREIERVEHTPDREKRMAKSYKDSKISPLILSSSV